MDFAQVRRNMVDCQLRTNKLVSEAVIDAFLTVPREKFVPQSKVSCAYVDDDLALDSGRFLMEPMVLARLLQAADIKKNDLVLDIGVSTGYSSVVLSKMASTVVALEENEDFRQQAAKNFVELQADNAVTMEGKLLEGCHAQAPFDVIVLQGSAEYIPEVLLDQLADGGRLVAVIGDGVSESSFSSLSGQGIAQAKLYIKKDGVVSSKTLFDAAVPRLPGFEREKEFTL